MVIYISICFIKLEMMFEWKKVHLFGFDKNISSCYNYRACLKPWRWVRRHTFTAWSNKPGKGELEFICIISSVSMTEQFSPENVAYVLIYQNIVIKFFLYSIKSLHILLAVSQILSQIIKTINQISSLECNVLKLFGTM